MTATSEIGVRSIPASHVLGRKLDSIPFSKYHLGVILVLGLVALVDGYDGSMTGTLLVLAKQPLNITPDQIRLLAVVGALTACIGGFVAAVFSDYWSRRTVLLLGVAPVLVYLLIPESPRWHLRRGNPEAAVAVANRIIGRCGNRVAPLTVTALGEKVALPREKLPPFTATVSPESAALDRSWHSEPRLRASLLLHNLGSAAEGADRSRRRHHL